MMPLKDNKEKKSRTVYRDLKRQIVVGDLTSDSPITETSLASDYGCSQGTIREALLSLQDDGLVVRRGYHGTYVTEIDREEAAVLLKLRQEIEMAGVVQAASRITRSDIDELYEANEQLETARAEEDEFVIAELNRSWHMRLFQTARIPVLEPALNRIIVQQSRVFLSLCNGPSIFRNPVNGAHTDILKAFEAHDTEGAKHAVAIHIAANAPLIAPFARPDFLDKLKGMTPEYVNAPKTRAS